MLTLRSRNRTKLIPDVPTKYPVGSFVKTEKGYFYIVENSSNNSRRLRVITSRVLNSWAPPRVAQSSESAVRGYRISSKLKFRNGSLIHNLADGKIYLIEEGKRRHITSPDVLTRLGSGGKDVVTVSLTEINLHEEGEPLN